MGKSGKAGRRRKIGATGGGADQNAAKTVLMILIAAGRFWAKGSGRANAVAKSIESGGLRRRAKEALQQERIKRDHAYCDAFCRRGLAQPNHLNNVSWSFAIAMDLNFSSCFYSAIRGRRVDAARPRHGSGKVAQSSGIVENRQNLPTWNRPLATRDVSLGRSFQWAPERVAEPAEASGFEKSIVPSLCTASLTRGSSPSPP
jgi:hypothetical protein